MNRTLTIFTGLVGTGATEVTQSLPSGTDLTDITKLITQIVILIATIWALFKKKKPSKKVN